MSVTPLKEYLEAVENYWNGDREQALDKLANALGADQPTNVMKNSLDKLLQPGLANDAILKILECEVKK